MRKYLANPTAGIKIIGYFAIWAILSETITILISGDIGAFLWITFHFILNPVIGGIVMLVAIWLSLKQNILWIRIVTLVSCVVPLIIIYLGYTGSFWIYEKLNVNFNRVQDIKLN